MPLPGGIFQNASMWCWASHEQLQAREWLEQYCCSLGTLSARKQCRQDLVYSYATVMTGGSVFVCVCVYTVGVHMWKSEVWHWLSSSCLRQGLSLDLKLIEWLGLLARKLQDLTPAATIPGFLPTCCRCERISLCLHCRHLPAEPSPQPVMANSWICQLSKELIQFIDMAPFAVPDNTFLALKINALFALQQSCQDLYSMGSSITFLHHKKHCLYPYRLYPCALHVLDNVQKAKWGVGLGR